MKAYQVTYRVGTSSTEMSDVIDAGSLEDAIAAVKAPGVMIVVESVYPIEFMVTTSAGASSVFRDRLEAQGYMLSLVAQGVTFSFSRGRA